MTNETQAFWQGVGCWGVIVLSSVLLQAGMSVGFSTGFVTRQEYEQGQVETRLATLEHQVQLLLPPSPHPERRKWTRPILGAR